MITLLYLKGSNGMTLEEKYGIIYENGKRYYQFDMETKLPILDDTVPYYFRYKNIEIYESSWVRMTIRIIEEVDKLWPKSEDELLELRYSWSKQAPFSREKRTNFNQYKNLYVNTNHTSTHAMMNIQCILKAYQVNLKECYFLIRKHFIAEPLEVREYIKNQTINYFEKYLANNHLSEEKITTVIKNFNIINKFLKRISTGFDDFFLFDDYQYFSNYKQKTLEGVTRRFAPSDKEYIIIKNCLNYLDNFYKNRKFYKWLEENKISTNLLSCIEKEINYLFVTLNTKIVVVNKLYARMSILYEDEMKTLNELNTPTGLLKICKFYYAKKYFIEAPYISSQPIKNMTNDQIIITYAYSLEKFSIADLNEYIDKMHLKKLDNYLKFIDECSEQFVQVGYDLLISKEVLQINENVLQQIKQEIIYYINSFGIIDSEKYCGYSTLPKTNYEWNKYLLVGIIRSFFSTDFELKYTQNSYKNLAYIIDIKK